MDSGSLFGAVPGSDSKRASRWSLEANLSCSELSSCNSHFVARILCWTNQTKTKVAIFENISSDVLYIYIYTHVCVYIYIYIYIFIYLVYIYIYMCVLVDVSSVSWKTREAWDDQRSMRRQEKTQTSAQTETPMWLKIRAGRRPGQTKQEAWDDKRSMRWQEQNEMTRGDPDKYTDRDTHVIKKGAGRRPAQQKTRDDKWCIRWQEKHEMTRSVFKTPT